MGQHLAEAATQLLDRGCAVANLEGGNSTQIVNSQTISISSLHKKAAVNNCRAALFLRLEGFADWGKRLASTPERVRVDYE